ncbi:ABC transporter F family member 4 [Anabrus simplex]|uniref:ABC transporter F family member 4 n=1 Tax=Anabrus simplex TaxID=316456 RepID=UPI0035A2B41C
MLLWNAKYVRPPPISSVLMSRGDLNIDKLELVCSQAVSILSNQKQLHMEAALLSRVLYRMKSKYRQNIGFKNIEKVNRGLLQYLSLDLFGVYSTFTALVPQVPRDPQVYLPTRQMLEWVLVRTQGFARLFCFIAQKCREAARHFHFLVTLGHTWETALLCMGLASRIWCFAKYMVTCSCNWYSQLKPFLQDLKCTGRNWLPSDYEFPEDLIKWLDAPWLTEHHKLKSLNPKKGVDKVLSRLMGPADDDDDEDVLDDSRIDIIDLFSGKVKLDEGSNKELLEVDDASESKNIDTRLQNLNKKPEIAHGEAKSITSVPEQWNKEDIGEKISRSSMKRMVAKLGKEAGLEPEKKRQKIETLVNISPLKHVEEVEPKQQAKRKEVHFITNGILKKVEEEDEEEEVILLEEEEEEMKKGKEKEGEEEDYSDVLVEDPEESTVATDKMKKLTVKSVKKFNLKPLEEGHQIHDRNYLGKGLLQDKSKFVKKEHSRISKILSDKSKINRLQGSQNLRAEAGPHKKLKPPKTKTSIPKTSYPLGHEKNSESISNSGPVPRQEINLLTHNSKKQHINSLKTVNDLERFLSRESKLRDKCSKKCLTRELDKLQWNMFYNAISVYVNKLNKKSVRKDKECYESLMKKARKAIKLRIL